MRSKKELAVTLSRLESFEYPKVELEQYATDSESAATVLWEAFMQGNLDDEVVADLGCGPGILGIGAYLLGAKGVYFVDTDTEALAVLKRNLAAIQLDDNYTILQEDIVDVELNVDVVVMNPPFGTREKHADRDFLDVAKRIAPVIITFHKSTTTGFVEAWTKDNGLKITHRWPVQLLLPKSFEHQSKKRVRIDVTAFRLERIE